MNQVNHKFKQVKPTFILTKKTNHPSNMLIKGPFFTWANIRLSQARFFTNKIYNTNSFVSFLFHQTSYQNRLMKVYGFLGHTQNLRNGRRAQGL